MSEHNLLNLFKDSILHRLAVKLGNNVEKCDTHKKRCLHISRRKRRKEEIYSECFSYTNRAQNPVNNYIIIRSVSFCNFSSWILSRVSLHIPQIETFAIGTYPSKLYFYLFMIQIFFPFSTFLRRLLPSSYNKAGGIIIIFKQEENIDSLRRSHTHTHRHTDKQRKRHRKTIFKSIKFNMI